MPKLSCFVVQVLHFLSRQPSLSAPWAFAAFASLHQDWHSVIYYFQRRLLHRMVAIEAPELLLDGDIRAYVLIPILVVVFAISVLRQNLTLIFQSAPSKDVKTVYER